MASEQAHSPQAGAVAAGKHQMVDDGAIQRFRRHRQTLGRAAVAVAGQGIAAGVIVGEDDPRTVVLESVREDGVNRKRGPGFIAVVTADVEAASLLVDMGNPQAFAGRIAPGEAAFEEASGGSESVEFQCMFGTLIHLPSFYARGTGQPNRTDSETNYCSSETENLGLSLTVRKAISISPRRYCPVV